MVSAHSNRTVTKTLTKSGDEFVCSDLRNTARHVAHGACQFPLGIWFLSAVVRGGGLWWVGAIFL